ncbi:MAG: hypothetical protein WAQ27_04205 [Candidatus Microsaccharimonas sp.]
MTTAENPFTQPSVETTGAFIEAYKKHATSEEELGRVGMIAAATEEQRLEAAQQAAIEEEQAKIAEYLRAEQERSEIIAKQLEKAKHDMLAQQYMLALEKISDNDILREFMDSFHAYKQVLHPAGLLPTIDQLAQQNNVDFSDLANLYEKLQAEGKKPELVFSHHTLGTDGWANILGSARVSYQINSRNKNNWNGPPRLKVSDQAKLSWAEDAATNIYNHQMQGGGPSTYSPWTVRVIPTVGRLATEPEDVQVSRYITGYEYLAMQIKRLYEGTDLLDDDNTPTMLSGYTSTRTGSDFTVAWHDKKRNTFHIDGYEEVCKPLFRKQDKPHIIRNPYE